MKLVFSFFFKSSSICSLRGVGEFILKNSSIKSLINLFTYSFSFLVNGFESSFDCIINFIILPKSISVTSSFLISILPSCIS